MQTQQSVKVLIVDDHPMVRGALSQAFAGFNPPIELLEAATPEKGLNIVVSRPDIDVVLLDLGYGDINGSEWIPRFMATNPTIPVVIFTGSTEAAELKRVIDMGVAGVIPKTHTPQEFVRAIEWVMGGRSYFPFEVTALVREAEQRLLETPLSPRQEVILGLLKKGLSNKEIGRELGISELTVKKHLVDLYGRIGVKNRTQAAQFLR
ncbi:MAG TPA: response regulator transcription factor [Burkholderiales bacterium]|nr:response regulator transcription factor [Burkholderiales bacterium]